MKRFSILILLAVLFSGCSSQYFLVISDEPTEVYTSSINENSTILIPANHGFVYSGNSVRKKVKYGNSGGFSITGYRWRKLAKFSKRRFSELTFNELYGYTHPSVPIERYAKSNYIYSPSGSTSTKTSKSTGGTVSVKGYTRKDGTYVKPHTRSAPKRRG